MGQNWSLVPSTCAPGMFLPHCSPATLSDLILPLDPPSTCASDMFLPSFCSPVTLSEIILPLVFPSTSTPTSRSIKFGKCLNYKNILIKIKMTLKQNKYIVITWAKDIVSTNNKYLF
jgi:hypothetical protein